MKLKMNSKQDRREFLKQTALVPIGLSLSGLLQSCVTKEHERPNIVFIMSDDHAYQAISAYSKKLTETPNIDRLANEGMKFTNACVANSICAPSRATILTGKHSHITGKVDNSVPLDDTQVTFPQLLQKAGYQTAMFGKYHLRNTPKGFDQFKILPGQGTYYNPDFITKNNGRIRPEGYTTDIITDMTLDWLKNEREDPRPFLLMCLHKAPHREWLPAKRHYGEYTQKKFEEPKTLFDNYEGRGSAAKQAEMNILKHQNWAGDSKITPEVMDELEIDETSSWDKNAFYREVGRMNEQQRAEWDKVYNPIIKDFKRKYSTMSPEDLMRWRYQRYMQDYLGCVAAVDEGVGKVLDCLDDNGLADNTIVVYTSDQGFHLGEHGWFDKRFIYEESFKTPLLVKWPKIIKPGTVNTQMVQNLDFAQTFLDTAGIDAPSDMQGESLLPLFHGRNKNFRDAVYYHYYEYPSFHMVKRHYGIVTEDYKLAHFYYDIDEWELYDRKKDPNEMKNVYDDPAYAGVVKDLKDRLAQMRVKYKDNKDLDMMYIQKHLSQQ